MAAAQESRMNRGELAPCGTRAAYRRHLRRYEQPCPACCAAAAEYVRKRRAALKAAQAPPPPAGAGRG
jgi:hypothetical protein